MKSILSRNEDGSIDILNEYGYTEYTVKKDESGLISQLVKKLAEYEEFINTQSFEEAINSYFDIPNDTYAYITRTKEAFNVGTMTLDDFEEFNEETSTDLAEFIRKQI